LNRAARAAVFPAFGLLLLCSRAQAAPPAFAPGPGWQAIDPVPSGLLAAYRHESGAAAIALLRIDYPNPHELRTSRAQLDAVERGVKEQSRGYRRISQRSRHIGRVVALDLTYRRDGAVGPEIARARFLFWPGYTIILIASHDAKAQSALRRSIERLVTGFFPKPANGEP
jgi:hypothetical protein